MNAVTMTEKLHDCRDAFVSVLERLGAENSKVVAVCNDSVGSSKLGGFKSKWPERLVNVGIAEQNMVGVGAGLHPPGHRHRVGRRVRTSHTVTAARAVLPR